MFTPLFNVPQDIAANAPLHAPWARSSHRLLGLPEPLHGHIEDTASSGLITALAGACLYSYIAEKTGSPQAGLVGAQYIT